MKFAMISDTHFGDPMSALMKEGANGQYYTVSKYPEFRDIAGSGNDYLVLVGDIFDFSLESYDKVYKVAKKKFSAN